VVAVTDPRRNLPSVDSLLHAPEIAALLARHPRAAVVDATRVALDRARARSGDADSLIGDIIAEVTRQERPTLEPVLNATGVVLHTNLGRAPVAASAARAMQQAASGYVTLEFDLDSGERGSRHDHCRRLLAGLTGAEDAMAVVNGAGALVVALHALAAGREVIISRGELIEIGGSFRLPDIVAAAGVVLREVGTTNRTRVEDYRRALSPATAAILSVHRSNFEIRGFSELPDPAELAALARDAGVPYLFDLGSGLLHDLSPWGLTGEPTVRAIITAGADLVIFSGDKLLGGPQAGGIAGRRDAVDRCRHDPLARATRCDKVTLAGLAETLLLHRDLDAATREIPVLAMLTMDRGELERRGARLVQLLADHGVAARCEPGASVVGGGAFPGVELPTTLVAVAPSDVRADTCAHRLRLGSPPVVARIHRDRVVLDCRTLPVDALPDVARAVATALSTS
jgi:L-seryl-tRNA(Ser) seleniumtransferase